MPTTRRIVRAVWHRPYILVLPILLYAFGGIILAATFLFVGGFAVAAVVANEQDRGNR